MRMGRETERERQRERETERERDRDRERETERERQRDTDIEREVSCINCITTIIIGLYLYSKNRVYLRYRLLKSTNFR